MKVSKYTISLFLTFSILHSNDDYDISQIGAAPIEFEDEDYTNSDFSSSEIQQNTNSNSQDLTNLNELGLFGPLNTNNYESTYTFTNCGATGRIGPSQPQADNAYSGNNTVTVNGGIQYWTVPVSGNYHIIASGAQGGNVDPHVGGKGAQISGDFYLTQGETIRIAVGQQGIAYDYDGSYSLGGSGGGGGSFVVRSPYNTNTSILLVAGGGGGSVDNSRESYDGYPGVTGTSGTDSHVTGSGNSYNGSAHGGENGNGGGNGCAAGGGGFFGNGNNGTHQAYGGINFVNGVTGGDSQNRTAHTYGGFGGGGAGSPSWGYGGGGGGYSGGGGGAWVNVNGTWMTGNGGGGGSYNNGDNTSSFEGTREGHGVVYISMYSQGNETPTADSQNITTNEDINIPITLSGSDEDGDNLTHNIVSYPNNGTLTGGGWTYTYIPSANWSGADVFTFTVSDGTETSELATVSITVNPVNDAPTAYAQSASGIEDEAQTITLAGNDVDGDDLTYVLVDDPTHGTVNLAGGGASTTHSTADFLDPENINIQLSLSNTGWEGSSAWSNSSGIYIGPHVSAQPQGFSTPDGDGYFVRNYNGQSSSKYAITKDGTNTISSNERGNIAFTADWAANRNWGARFVAIVDGTWYASDQFGMGANDHGNMNQAQVTDWEVDVSVNADTDNWYISLANSPSGYAWRDGNQWSTTPVSGGGLPEGDITQFGMAWLQKGNNDYGAVDNFRVINNGGGTGTGVTYTPNQNYNGPDSFTYAVSDGEATSEAATVNITLTAVNDLPIITSSPTLDALEESQYNYSINVNDVDGDAITLTAPTKPDWLSIIDNNTNSLDFDGINDYVEISNTSQLEPGSQVTVSTWAYMDNWSSANDSRILSNTQSGGFALAIDVSWNQDKLGFYINIDGTYLHPDIALSSLSSGWHHITGTYDNRYAKLYIDGILVDVVDNGSNNDINYGSDINLFIGAEPIDANNSTSLYFNGSVNEVSIFDAALNLSEIHANMNNGLTGDENGLVGYWNFNEGSGSILTDQSSNGNDGTINGASWSTDVAYSSYVLTGTPSPSDGGLHNVVLNIDDSNGGIATQSFSIGVAVTHLDITGESGFRILSSPVSGAIFSDLLEELWTQGSEGSDHEGADPNVWTYDNGWVPVEDLNNDVLSAGQGFVVYVFADTDFDGDDDLPVTIDIDGSINETAVSVTANPSQWNLVGNPYGLDVSINQILSDNSSRFNSTVYRLDDVNPGYRTHNGTVGDIDRGLIKPFDGFWVQADTEGDVFEFTEQSIRKGSIDIGGGGRSTTNESTGSAIFTFTNGQFTSNVYLSFTENGHINLDPADAKQIIPMSPAEHLTSMIHESGKSLSINNLPLELTTDIAFDMDVMLLTPHDEGYETQSEQVTMTWDIGNLPEGISLSLVNNGTGQTVNLYGYPSSNVSLPSKGGFSFPENLMETYPEVGESQFTLSVYTDITSNDDEDLIVPEDITLHNAYPNPFNPSTIISFDILEMDNVSLNIFDLTGRQVATLINEFMIPGNHQISWNPGLLPSGVYLVELAVGDRSFNQKITYIK